MGAATLLCPIESRGPNTRRDLARYVQCISFGFRVRAQKGTAQNLPRPVNNPFTILFRLFFFSFSSSSFGLGIVYIYIGSIISLIRYY